MRALAGNAQLQCGCDGVHMDLSTAEQMRGLQHKQAVVVRYSTVMLPITKQTGEAMHQASLGALAN